MLKRKELVMAVVFALAAGTANAGVIVGGSLLLTGADVTQLENWLGEGALTLTNIFTKGPDSNSFDFHNAADGQGRTFVVMQATNSANGQTGLIGGYNPQSWSQSRGYNLSSTFDAFIFNLTTGLRNIQGNYTCAGCGIYQTYNTPNYGPTFGGGHDIWVNTDLSNGYVNPFTYSALGGANLLGTNGHAHTTISGIEVFTIGNGVTSVPEPATMALFGIGLLGVAAARRRKVSIAV